MNGLCQVSEIPLCKVTDNCTVLIFKLNSFLLSLILCLFAAVKRYPF